MSEANVSNLLSNIGLIPVFVRRANTRFAPTLVSEIGWISITTIYPKIYDRLLMNSFSMNVITKTNAIGIQIAAKNHVRKGKTGSFFSISMR